MPFTRTFEQATDSKQPNGKVLVLEERDVDFLTNVDWTEEELRREPPEVAIPARG
jgi:hypothetical protein